MKKISTLPQKSYTIGIKEVMVAIKSGSVKNVIVASNCPRFLLDRIEKAGAEIEVFAGDQQELGTKLGRPFPVVVIGYQ
ncbi:MAG: ribosomal L7Ae/L30e/S12e/Gadd45 family protein [Candidatus Aenigmatarchaeota archaeon]